MKLVNILWAKWKFILIQVKTVFLEYLQTPIFSCTKNAQERLVSLNNAVYFSDSYLTNIHKQTHRHSHIYVYLQIDVGEGDQSGFSMNPGLICRYALMQLWRLESPENLQFTSQRTRRAGVISSSPMASKLETHEKPIGQFESECKGWGCGGKKQKPLVQIESRQAGVISFYAVGDQTFVLFPPTLWRGTCFTK